MKNRPSEYSKIRCNNGGLSFLEAVFFPFIEQVRLSASEVHNLRAAVPVFLLLRTLFAVVSIGDSQTSAYDTPALEWAVVALIAHSHQSAWPHIRVTNHALPVTLLAQPPYCNPWLLPAHNQIRMMLRHAALLPLPEFNTPPGLSHPPNASSTAT